MHWLCFDPASPRLLEEAGFQYDSTFGYNDAVGYRAGTAQAFRPPGVTNLLELPLHIQDTALLSNSRKTDAWRVCDAILRNASKHGGVLTLLWHTRSLAPERQWGGFYQRLLERLKGRVWYGSAGEVVEWFRKRRAFSFTDLTRNYKSETCETPGLLLRFHDPGKGTRDFDWSDCGKSYGENMHDHLQRVCL
jgi:hypothetical protein